MLAASVMATHKIAGASLYRRHDFRVFVHIEASNVPVSEILSALEAAFSVRHRTSVPLDQAISGTYKGPLRRVLDGFNYYIANTVEGRMEITVIGKHGAAAMVANLPTAQTTVAPQGLVVPPPQPRQKSMPSGKDYITDVLSNDSFSGNTSPTTRRRRLNTYSPARSRGRSGAIAAR